MSVQTENRRVNNTEFKSLEGVSTSVVAAPASAQTMCPTSGGLAACGYVLTDTNNNGIPDASLSPIAGEPPIEGIQVIVCQLCNGMDNTIVYTDTSGSYYTPLPGGTSYTVAILIPTGTQAIVSLCWK